MGGQAQKSSITITVQLPAGISAEGFAGVLQDRAEVMVSEINAALYENNLRAAAVESWAGVVGWMEAHPRYGLLIGKPPVTRANRYSEVWPEQELSDWICGGPFHDDERRPVYLRAAIKVLFARYSKTAGSLCANGWCEDVMERYFRRFKTVPRNGRKHHEAAGRLISRMYGKPWGCTISPAQFRKPYFLKGEVVIRRQS